MYDYERSFSDHPVWKNANTWVCRRHTPAAKMHASVEHCLYGCRSVTRPDNRPSPAPAPLSSSTAVPSWENFDRLSDTALEAQSIEALRKYAANKLGIVGASKIRGGKAALMPVILASRA